METSMTVKELLEMTATQLKEIMVPVAYANEIARPLCQAVANIQTCIDAFTNEPEPETQTDKQKGEDADGVPD